VLAFVRESSEVVLSWFSYVFGGLDTLWCVLVDTGLDPRVDAALARVCLYGLSLVFA
jgi:hypothetical protein